MKKSEKPPRKRSGAVTYIAIGLLMLLAIVSVAQVGQQGAKVQKKDLVDKLEAGLGMKEPGFKLHSKRKHTHDDISNLLAWKSGEDFIDATAYEFVSQEEAAAHLATTINLPVSAPSETSQLNNLGDDAYIRPHGQYSKPGRTSLFFRRGNVLVTIYASSPELAKRFAKHIVDEIDQP